jgi:hypothetical protein
MMTCLGSASFPHRRSTINATVATPYSVSNHPNAQIQDFEPVKTDLVHGRQELLSTLTTMPNVAALDARLPTEVQLQLSPLTIWVYWQEFCSATLQKLLGRFMSVKTKPLKHHPCLFDTQKLQMVCHSAAHSTRPT